MDFVFLVSVFAIIIGVLLLFYYVPVGLWFTARISGVKVSILDLILMRIRKVPPSVIINSSITATKAGL
ncbi:MAG: flotillin-like FloA family protein, partial [Flammeovirgaceae bacterium]